MVAVLFLSACSANIEEETKATEEKVVAAFNAKPEKTNKSNDEIQFFLPFGYEIKEKKQNNIILKNGGKTIILFYNSQEDAKSEVVYNATVAKKKKYQFDKTFKKDDQFGYLLIREVDDKRQEVTVGIGGIKLTTNSKVSSMAADAEVMMQIAKSVKDAKKDNKKEREQK